MMNTKPTSRILALLLVMLLIFSITPLSTIAEDSEAEPQATGVIIAFDALAEDVAIQNVSAGTKENILTLPDKLDATIDGETSSVMGVTWLSDPVYDGGTAGTYTFTAQIPDEYTMEDGVNAPVIAVTVEQAAEEPSSITYDTQPTSIEEVRTWIDIFETAYTDALNSSGFLAAVKAMNAAKPRWQYVVEASLIPSGYNCQLVSDDTEFGAEYYTLFVSAAATSEIWAPGEIIVETEAEFIAALANSTYTTIYLGADITMLSNSSATAAARTGTLVINGTDPRNGTRHTYKDYASATAYATLRGPYTNITFKDIEVYINTYFGIYMSTSSGETVTFDGVTGQAGQFYYGYGAASTLVIKDSALTLCKTHTYTQELVQNAGTVRFEGEVTVTREPGSYPNAYWDEIFYLTGTGSTVEIVADANVTIDNNVTTGDYGGGAIFYNVDNFVVGAGASFTCYSTTGFADPDATVGALRSVTIRAGADVRFICTTSHYWGSSGLRGMNFTAESGANFLLYNVDTTGTYGAFHFTNVTLNNQESFIVLNPSSAAIGTNTCNLKATDVSSIRYYGSSSISGLFDTGSYAYMPTADYNRLWVQSASFNFSTTNSWTNASPAITTNYSAPSASAAETSITSSNFSARTVYGIEIRGSSYTVSGTVRGLPDNSNLTITYTIDNGTAQTVPTDTGGDYVIEGVPFGARVVITPPPAPQYYTLSPESIPLDSVTGASTGNDFTYTKIIHSVTEKYADEAGNPIQDATTAEVSVGQTYTYAGTTANIIAGTDIYVYQGYKMGTYNAGVTLDGTGTPVSIALTGDTTVHLIYKKLAIGSITIEKYGDKSGSTALTGAEFTIERWDGDTGAWIYIKYDSVTKTWSDTASGDPHYTQPTAGADGTTTFTDLPLNKYRIQEAAPPNGYATLREPIITEVPYTIDETDPNYAAVTGSKAPDNTVLNDGVNTAYYYNMTYTITDTAVLDMPTAGGSVTPVMLVLAGLGIALLAAAGYIFYKRRRTFN